MLASAKVRFTGSIMMGNAKGSAIVIALARAAPVGRARTHLQAGRGEHAATCVDAVPESCSFGLPFVDNLAQRKLLRNGCKQCTSGRGSIGVSEVVHVRPDARVRFNTPAGH